MIPESKAILVTGAAKRGGAAIAKAISAKGYDVILHCRQSSAAAAYDLAAELQKLLEERNSLAVSAFGLKAATVWVCDLNEDIGPPPDIDRIHGIVANASEYIPSQLDGVMDYLPQSMRTHVSGHLKLIQHCAESLKKNKGSVVAVTDIHVGRPHKGFLAYQIAKGALESAVRTLAVDLAPHVRVNAVAPGPLSWPDNLPVDPQRKKNIMATTPLARAGTFEELAAAVCYLLFDATFTTGATLPVDGGRSIFLE